MTKQELEDLIIEGDIGGALKALRTALPDNQIILNLLGQWNRLTKDIESKRIDPLVGDELKNRITKSVAKLVEKMDVASKTDTALLVNKDEVLELLKKGGNDDVVDQVLEGLLKGYPEHSVIITLKGKWDRLQHNDLIGVISRDSYAVERSQLISAIVDLAKTDFKDVQAVTPNKSTGNKPMGFFFKLLLGLKKD